MVPDFIADSGIACPSTSACYAAGANGIVATTDSGSSWSKVVQNQNFNELWDLACPSLENCVAVGGNGQQWFVNVSNDPSLAWTGQELTGGDPPQNGTNWLGAVSCVTATLCLALGQHGYVLTGSAPTITTSSLPAATRGALYRAQLQAAGGTPPFSWSKQGTLPYGLHLAGSGTISGTPKSNDPPGNYVITFKVRDATQPYRLSATKQFTLTLS